MRDDNEAIKLLAACRPLAGKLTGLESCYNYELSLLELEALRGYERVLHAVSPSQFNQLSAQAGLAVNEVLCLVNLDTIVCLRALLGKDVATGRLVSPPATLVEPPQSAHPQTEPVSNRYAFQAETGSAFSGLN